ncbi:DEAH (Asp-Glu-Ala-His) box polypeptide 34 [Perkinsus olseni]|uniref:DEAH (Asp-Glu-Ala-His) box polypeptide 34 n=1 Tax=Perkinsus olseni TaxID=32597 RepID=A0A7J6QUQ7_PEROL|nr:DEAH (Asp-Glu-Ala-His) box polypeptide 34 [Perkinsus olseni]
MLFQAHYGLAPEGGTADNITMPPGSYFSNHCEPPTIWCVFEFAAAAALVEQLERQLETLQRRREAKEKKRMKEREGEELGDPAEGADMRSQQERDCEASLEGAKQIIILAQQEYECRQEVLQKLAMYEEKLKVVESIELTLNPAVGGGTGRSIDLYADPLRVAAAVIPPRSEVSVIGKPRALIDDEGENPAAAPEEPFSLVFPTPVIDRDERVRTALKTCTGEVEARIRERLFEAGSAASRGMLAGCEEDFDAFLDMYRHRVAARRSHNDSGSHERSSFERKYTINFSIPMLQGGRHHSSRDEVFEDAIRFYSDMRLKQSNQKLRKLMSSRAALPIAKHREQILAAMESSRVVLIAGDTGCGKSTQVPQYLLEADRDASIICTQPRRLAAMSLCRRVQTEQLQAWGSRVAYQMRFDNTRTRHTRILFVTEGLLLRLLESDGELSDFNVLLLDEVHERHAPMDVILTYIPELLQRRSDLKIILMSATFDTEHFRDLFNLSESAVISVSGRSYPVTTEYIRMRGEPPPQAAANMHRAIPSSRRRRKGDDGPSNAKEAVLDCGPYLALLKKIHASTPKHQSGDALVFLSGAQEIECLCNAIRDDTEVSRTWIPLPLHAQLPVEEQDKAFDIAPRGMRKCVIATNVAETSITIDGIRFVIDSGKVKEMSVDAGSSTRRLAEQWISEASADQRKGRAGRTGPGQCYRMYSEELCRHMMGYTRPEITRNFHSLVHSLLQLLALDVDVSPRDGFRFPTDIPEDTLRLARNYLCLARAATRTSTHSTTLRLTPTGRVLSRLPVSISVGNMLLMSMILGTTAMRVATIIAASLNFHSPFRYGEYSSDDSADLLSDSGDLFTCYNVYTAWLKRRVQSREGARRWARERGIDESKMYEMSKSAQQLQGQLREGRGGRSAATDTQKKMQVDAMALLEGRHEGDSTEEGAATTDPAADRDKQRLRSELAKLKAQQLHRGRKILDVDMITGGKEEIEKFSGVEEDSDDAVDSDDSCGGRRRFTGHQPARKARKLRASDVGERSLRLRQLDIEFDLRLADGGSAGGERLFGIADQLSSSKMRLLATCIGKALYPNIAYPATSNRTEGTAKDCLFTVLAGSLTADRYASIHPQSVLYPIANEISPQTECLGFSSLLLTYRPFVVHCIRLPLLSTLLFAAADVNTNSDSDALVIDQRVYITTRGSIEKLLCSALVIRKWLEGRTDLEIAALFEAFDWGDSAVSPDPGDPDNHPSSEARLPAALRRAQEDSRHPGEMEKLQSRMLELQDMAAAVEFSWQIISEGDAGILTSSLQGERVAPWLTWGNVDDTDIDVTSGQVSDSLRVNWRCPDCGFEGRLNRKEISDHKRRLCSSIAAQAGEGASSDVPTDVMESGVADEANDNAKCEYCGLDLATMNTMEILEHQRSHGRA